MPAISAVIITSNEERRLPEALASVAFCDERVVVDSGSSDRTAEVAQAAGARFVTRIPWPGFVAQKNAAVAEAAHDWILSIDADERVSAGLRLEIEALQASQMTCAGYRIPRLSHYLGRWIRATDWYPDRQLRLFDRRRGRWQGGAVHESVRVDGPVGRLRHDIEHHPYSGIDEHLRTIDLYTTLWADRAAAEGRRTHVGEICGAPLWSLTRNLILRRGIVLGGVGCVVSILNSYYTFLKLAKLFERTHARGPLE
jgi:glycosyltransferase involved in cell wall biosynthesis